MMTEASNEQFLMPYRAVVADSGGFG